MGPFAAGGQTALARWLSLESEQTKEAGYQRAENLDTEQMAQQFIHDEGSAQEKRYWQAGLYRQLVPVRVVPGPQYQDERYEDDQAADDRERPAHCRGHRPQRAADVVGEWQQVGPEGAVDDGYTVNQRTDTEAATSKR